jgi:hypothetical protein
MTLPICSRFIFLSFISASFMGPFYFSISAEGCACFSYLPPMCYMLRSFCAPQIFHHNNIWQIIQIMKLYMVQCSSSFCYFLFQSSKYFLQQIVLWSHKESYQVSRPCETTAKNMQNIYISMWETGKLVDTCSTVENLWLGLAPR